MLFTTFLLPLAVSAAILQQRDTATSAIPVDKLTPRYRKTANRMRYKMGPYTLRGAKSGSGLGDSTMRGQTFRFSMPRTLCNSQGACTILAGQVGTMFTDGKIATPASGIYIHHILTSDSTKKQNPWLSNCNNPNTPAVNIAGLLGGTAFIGTGEDSNGLTVYTSKDGTRNTGYHVGAQDTFSGVAQLVNYNKESKQVYVYYDLEWVPGIVGEDVKTATFTATCGGSRMIKLSPTGPANTTSGNFHFMEDGKILGGMGHLHDGGIKMDMFLNDKFICSSEAVYGMKTGDDSDSGMEGHSHGGGSTKQDSSSAKVKTISAMTACSGPIPVKKGDRLKLIAEYDLSKHPLRKSASGGQAADVMGMMAVEFTAAKQ